ncbi:hypothetical protein [Oceanimonas smirnovii]|uniref:hypothetical protein n=1 Tax=Oceanimonas smirnovii TaxID=264574 RepID=UPI003FD3DE0B
MTETLKAYAGPHAGTLHHVVEQETGRTLRNATALEVRQFAELTNLHSEVRRLRTAMNYIAHITGTHGQDHNATIKAVAGLVAGNISKEAQCQS